MDYAVSERRVCKVLQLNRGSKRRGLGKNKDQELTKHIYELSNRYPRFGYRKIWAKLLEIGFKVGREKVRLIRKREGLSLNMKKPKKRRVGNSSGMINQANHVNQVWSYDFVSDQTTDGRTLKCLTIVDEYTRRGLRVYCGRSITSGDVLKQLEQLIGYHGVPSYIRSDNGPEFIAQALQKWLAQNKIKTHYIDPGSPWQNGHCEGFNAVYRDGCLDRYLFSTVKEAQQISDMWLEEYNNERPHGGIDMMTPMGYYQQCIINLASQATLASLT